VPPMRLVAQADWGPAMGQSVTSNSILQGMCIMGDGGHSAVIAHAMLWVMGLLQPAQRYAASARFFHLPI